MDKNGLKRISIVISKEVNFRKISVYFLIYSLLKGFIIPTIYLQFSSMIVEDIKIASYYLLYLVLLNIITDFLQKRLKYCKTDLSLEFLEKFVTISFGILLGTDLLKIEDRKTQKFENKYNRAFAALRMLVKDSLEQIFKIPSLFGLFLDYNEYLLFCYLFNNFI